MATAKQRQAARKNIKKAQEAWRSMSSRARSKGQPEGWGRAKPGTTGKGEYYHIEVRPKKEFTTFRTQDVGEKGGIQRVAGKRGSGSWDTQKWLISKDEAHLDGDRLVPDTREARSVENKAEFLAAENAALHSGILRARTMNLLGAEPKKSNG